MKLQVARKCLGPTNLALYFYCFIYMFLDIKWNMVKQRQIICPLMTFISLSSFGAKLQVIETDMTHIKV